jgi:uncharacterized protein YqeY
MPLEQQLSDLLKDAMRAKDEKTLDVVRMLKTKIMERRTAPGFKGTVDDALVGDVIAAYRKQLQKALVEFESAGDRAAEQRDKLRFEIEFCERFLPKGLSGDELVAVVRAAIAASGVTDPKMAGKVVGEVMKTHKGKVDAGEVKKIAESELTKAKGGQP